MERSFSSKTRSSEKFPNEDLVRVSGGVCDGRERGGSPLINIVYAFTRGLQVLQLSVTCQPGRISSQSSLHRGCKTA